ncbi:MAG: hypothetical protein F4Y78_01460 [Candidatus Dadabacteria bacterium]|nr:hypothetical protein [Candidatus Dadabacteria bacterium]MYA48384.1 hypothetical protein [Candidatus Dadabacteria bacterium]MYK49263.1 hypothetical protein [Candidatus Dadabacteria bacterium]
MQRYADEFALGIIQDRSPRMEQMGKTVDGMVGKKVITTGFRFFHCESHEKRTKASRSPFRKS